MICVSNRPAQLEHIVDTWQRQMRVDVELVLVTNVDGYAPRARALLEPLPQSMVIETDESVTLGAALNRGIAASSGTVVAKVDDDDLYSSRYLFDGVETLRRTKAGVVGKKSHFVFVEAIDQTILRFPNAEHQRVGRVAGGTLVMHRDVLDEVGFDDVNVGEDTAFARAVEHAGWAVASGGAAGYLQIRGRRADHTWQPEVEQLLKGSRIVGAGKRAAYWELGS